MELFYRLDLTSEKVSAIRNAAKQLVNFETIRLESASKRRDVKTNTINKLVILKKLKRNFTYLINI